jgi:hypothetical protein
VRRRAGNAARNASPRVHEPSVNGADTAPLHAVENGPIAPLNVGNGRRAAPPCPRVAGRCRSGSPARYRRAPAGGRARACTRPREARRSSSRPVRTEAFLGRQLATAPEHELVAERSGTERNAGDGPARRRARGGRCRDRRGTRSRVARRGRARRPLAATGSACGHTTRAALARSIAR